MVRIASDDERLTWSGAVSLERGDGWVKPWRVPYEDLDLYSPGDPALAVRAEMPSGVRLRFGTDAERFTFETQPMNEIANVGAGPSPKQFDLYVGDTMASRAEFTDGATSVQLEGLPAGEKTVDVWLPQGIAVALRGIDLPEGTRLYATSDDRPRWVVYGSSITHCRTAESPSYTWPGIVARARGLNLTSLGLGGQCHADPMIARLIRDLPADLITLKLGINIYGNNTMSGRTFRPAVLGTIATIRDGHPDTPLVLCSPIFGVHRETTPNDTGMTLPIMRDEIRDAVESFRRRGDDRIYYVDGLKLFGEDLAHLLPDNLHPNPEGYKLLAQNFLHEVFNVQGVQDSSVRTQGPVGV
ncbi:MAG: GDSL family lipase [Chloroflexi bacterium]|nr:MAG: GDSL family lipase [Chloroflexota bacterium]